MSNKSTLTAMDKTQSEQMPLAEMDQRANEVRSTLKVEEAATLLGISRAIAYRSAQEFLDSNGARGLPVIRLGRRLLVPKAQFNALLNGKSK